MSLRGKEVRPLIDEINHERLSILAEYRDLQLNECASRLLEQAIAYEWQELSVLIERVGRMEKRWNLSDSVGKPRSGSEALRNKSERDDD